MEGQNRGNGRSLTVRPITDLRDPSTRSGLTLELSSLVCCMLDVATKGNSSTNGARFAQAWRKRTTLQHTPWMTQCHNAFNESSVPSDALIRPLTQASELLSRVSTYYSYDDLENAEIKGEIMLNMSASSFLGDLTHLKSFASLSPFLQQNSKCTVNTMLYKVWADYLHSHLESNLPTD